MHSAYPLPKRDDDQVDLEDIGHPRGTLVIVALFGLLFALGWAAFYVLGFLHRGSLSH